MLKLIFSALFVQVAITHAHVFKLKNVVGQSEQVIECQQEPMELGIVLDSSSSISYADFQKSITFLQNFVSQYEIGDGPNDVRVSIITFGKGIYPRDSFDLTTYKNKEEVIKALGKVPHRVGLYTSTGEAIEYMSETQLSKAVSRPHADRVSIVLTDGNSQVWRKTRDAAQAARDSGIIMFAVGVGAVRREELLRIAGNESRVVKVDSYDQLEEIKTDLAQQTCVKKEKQTTVTTTTTTTPLPLTERCGKENPADIYFVFSPADLGLDATAWTTSLISTTVRQKEMENGFRFGVVSGSCPDDEGFDLNDYSTVEGIDTRLTNMVQPRMTTLIKRLSTSGYSKASGGRSNARDVAVLVANDGKKNKGLEAEVRHLMLMGVQVFIADPTNSGIRIDGATTLTGRSAKSASADLITRLCPVRTGEA
ncbi:collagen alpha-5(VI) chain [Aplysia californica]|uniref:Collagen alpha-5(VI) chain n=1 Tax=Aplysia californica TaxID=6500 RepID=A0ABM0K2T3_APLCA|nr:collagen alpha-5(VI) chain [Aplysia californica]